jgi:hypothetical protein
MLHRNAAAGQFSRQLEQGLLASRAEAAVIGTAHLDPGECAIAAAMVCEPGTGVGDFAERGRREALVAAKAIAAFSSSHQLILSSASVASERTARLECRASAAVLVRTEPGKAAATELAMAVLKASRRSSVQDIWDLSMQETKRYARRSYNCKTRHPAGWRHRHLGYQRAGAGRWSL